MVTDDNEIEKFRVQEQSGTAAARREASERRRQIRIFAEKAKKLKRAKDARAYGQLLREAKIREDSQQWKDAWNFFYGRS